MNLRLRLVTGILGGFTGGAVAGIGESIVVAVTSEITEYWIFLFATISYGTIGAFVGGCWGIASAIYRPLRSELGAATASAGLTAALLGLVVARFRIVRDVFGESLPLGSVAGLLVHAGLLVGAGVIYLVIAVWIRRKASRHGPFAATVRAAVATATIGAIVAISLNVAVVEKESPDTIRASTATGPDVLLIIADTLRADHIGPYGAKNAKTPALDTLAADGIVFENAFAQSSWTRPSIATILTGLYPGSHAVMHKTDLLPSEVVTLAESLQEAGYRTGGFVTNINVAPSFNFQQGFDQYRYLSPDFFFRATDSGSKLALYSGMRLVRERFLSRQKLVAHYYQDADTVTQASLPWLDETAGQTSFALVHYMDPHDPFFEIPYNGKAVARVETPNPAAERAGELRRLYASNVEYMDGFLGKIFSAMKMHGTYDDTMIVFTSDHGEEFYEHGGWWHGTTLYDEQIHVPLIVKLPKQHRAGSRDEPLARLVDVAPTILAATGVTPPAGVQGRDLFAGGEAPRVVYAEEDHEGNVLESVRTREWKLILANAGNPRGLAPVELYDLRKDPRERDNVADQSPEKVGELRKDLALLREASRASAVAGVTGSIDAADEERLRALGYLE